MDNLTMLADECICKILSLTSPADAEMFSIVSSSFGHVSKCDLVWETFLPSNYLEIVSRTTLSPNFYSKRDLFIRLCQSVLIDDCNKSLKLEKLSGKISYILSAKELSIAWSDSPSYWTWNSLPESSFKDKFKPKSTLVFILSPNTAYGAYIIIKIPDSAYGLDSIPSVVSLEMGGNVIENTAYLRLNSEKKKEQMQRLFYKHRMEILSSRVNVNGEGRVPRERDDGWLEFGEFYNGGDGYDDYDEVKMNLKEAKGYQMKGGLVVKGIEVRPK